MKRILELALLGAVILSSAAGAQVPRTLVFTDTSWIRIETKLAGSSVRASIVGSPRDTLWSGTLSVSEGGFSRTVSGIHPKLWSPSSPTRYTIVVSNGASADTIRAGFRKSEMKDGHLLLNGKPIFIRGNAINPPGRTIPDSLGNDPRFAADYIKYLKSININMIRTTNTAQEWMDAADSLGMLVYQGLYGSPKGYSRGKPGGVPFADVIASYHDILEPLTNHPSVVIYVLSNELASRDVIHTSQEGADTTAKYMRRVYETISAWDSTRAYITNAGYGYGREGGICDMHHYWAYYYNTALSYYTLRDPTTCWRTPERQPITISEGVASYTGGDGRFNIVSGSKQMSSALNFGGHTPVDEQPAQNSGYQAFVVRNAIEIMRRTRNINPYLHGIMPFTTLFSEWWNIKSFADMRPSPAAKQMAISYQPVLLSWENWTTQLYAGATFRPTVHIVNDDTLGRDLRSVEVRWTVRDAKGAAKDSGRVAMGDVKYFGTISKQLAITLPAAQGEYTLDGRAYEAGKEISHNETHVFVAARTFAGSVTGLSRRVLVYDDSLKRTSSAFRKSGVPFTAMTTVSGLSATGDLLVIGEQAWDVKLSSARSALTSFVKSGGRILMLQQDSSRFDTSWLSAKLVIENQPADAPGDRREGNPFRNGMAVNPEWSSHPVFDGVGRDRLFLWSDPSGWTETSDGLPAVYPVTNGFTLANPADLGHVAMIADYGRGLEGIGLAEVFDGQGSVMVSGFDFANHAGLDPAADRLLANIIRYEASAAAHYAHVLATQPIVWGDYGSEMGTVVDIYSGLLTHTVPIVPTGLERKFPLYVDENGFLLAGGRNGWNTQPAIWYVARGRRPYGPIVYDIFGDPKLPAKRPALGTGSVWVRVPATTRTVSTTIENQADTALTISITINGTTRERSIPAQSRVAVDVPVTRQGTADSFDLAMTFVGDRRLVLVQTDFR